MKKAKLRVSELGAFENEVCADCLNDDGDNKMCVTLGQLAAMGECDMVYEMDFIDIETGSFQKCMMRRVDEEVSVKSIFEWIDTTSTEEVGEVLSKIENSYHHDVIKDKQLNKNS